MDVGIWQRLIICSDFDQAFRVLPLVCKASLQAYRAVVASIAHGPAEPWMSHWEPSEFADNPKHHQALLLLLIRFAPERAQHDPACTPPTAPPVRSVLVGLCVLFPTEMISNVHLYSHRRWGDLDNTVTGSGGFEWTLSINGCYVRVGHKVQFRTGVHFDNRCSRKWVIDVKAIGGGASINTARRFPLTTELLETTAILIFKDKRETRSVVHLFHLLGVPK